MNQEKPITTIAKAFVKAQSEMTVASKDSTNPFFKSKYADLNSIREACMPALNRNGISVIQPIVQQDGKNYVHTILLHESGEMLTSMNEIICNKPSDAQSYGSGLTYARRYGLQSLCNIGADDDDGTKAVTNTKEWLNAGANMTAAKEAISSGKFTIADVEKKYKLTDATRAELIAIKTK